MSDFDDLLAAGFAEVNDAIGVPIAVGGVAAKCVPGSAQRERELRQSGLWETGMVVVELLRTEAVRLGIADRVVVDYDGRKMKVFIIDDDPADPCLRVTLKPDNRAK